MLQTLTNTVIYIYYGDAAVTCSQKNATGVWDSNYREVFHLHETGDHTDSTANGFTAVTKGTVNQGVAGKIGPADDFIGPTESRLIISDGELAANTSFTFEAWVYIRNLQAGTWTGLVTKGRDNSADWVGIGKSSSNNLALIWQCCNPPTQPGNLNGPALSTGQWYYIAGTYDSGTTTRTVYLDGAPVATDTLGAQYPALPEYTRVGDDSNGNYHDGLIDEVRISSIARSADWIQTTYNNQKTPGTFYAVGAEDSSPPVVIVTCPTVEAPCQGIGSGTCHLAFHRCRRPVRGG